MEDILKNQINVDIFGEPKALQAPAMDDLRVKENEYSEITIEKENKK